MTEPQKAISRELLKNAYSHGFDASFPLAPIAEKLGIKEVLYDTATSTGVLWDLGPYGEGLLDVSADGTHAGVCIETRDQLAHWSDYKGW